MVCTLPSYKNILLATDFAADDLTLGAVSKHVLESIRDAIAPKARERAEKKARVRLKDKGKALLEEASEQFDEKVGDKLKGLFKR